MLVHNRPQLDVADMSAAILAEYSEQDAVRTRIHRLVKIHQLSDILHTGETHFEKLIYFGIAQPGQIGWTNVGYAKVAETQSLSLQWLLCNHLNYTTLN